MKLTLLFTLTGVAIFIQMALGGLVTFGYLDTSAHTVMGVVVLALALLTFVTAWRLNPRPRTLAAIAVQLVIFIVIQGALGFAAEDTGNNIISWVHLLNAVGIVGLVVAGRVTASFHDGTPAGAQTRPTR